MQASVLDQADNPSSWDKVLAAGADYVLTDLPKNWSLHVLDRQLRPRPVRFACHRGASRYAPENTLPAFEKAYRLHADFVEFDVRPSRDGKFFLLHDGKLNRTTNGKGPIRDATTATIAEPRRGQLVRPAICRHARAVARTVSCRRVPADVNLYFDAKDIPPEALAAAINKHDLVERTIVYQSADLSARAQADRSADSRDAAGRHAGRGRTGWPPACKPYAVDTRWNVLSKEYIDHCHAAGHPGFLRCPGPGRASKGIARRSSGAST